MTVGKKIYLSKYVHIVPMPEGRYLISHGILGYRAVVNQDVVQFLETFRNGFTEEELNDKYASQTGFKRVLSKFKSQYFLIQEDPQLDREHEAFLQVVSDLRTDRPSSERPLRAMQDEFTHRAAKTYSELSLKDLSVNIQYEAHVGILMDCMLERTANLLENLALKEGIRLKTYFLDVSNLSDNIPKLDFVIVRNVNASASKVLLDSYYSNSPSEQESLMDMFVLGTERLVNELSNHTKAPILLHTLTLPSDSPLGPFAEAMASDGLFDTIRLINQRLKELATKSRSCYLLDEDHFVGNLGRLTTMDNRIMTLSHSGPIEMTGTYEVSSYGSEIQIPKRFYLEEALAHHYLSFLKILKGTQRKKLILVDLDNTLWPGLIGEDDFDINNLDPIGTGARFVALHQTLSFLKQRGLLLAIVSKNNESDVIQKWAITRPELKSQLLTLQDFVSHRINWKPKDQNIADILDELDLTPDAAIFIDDNPVELTRVQMSIPQLTIVPADSKTRQALFDIAELQSLKITQESAERSEMVKGQVQRKRFSKQFVDPSEFLHQLELKYRIEVGIDEKTINRVHELFLRTNQFNTTTIRYTLEEIQSIQNDPKNSIFLLYLSDRFTQYGQVGVCICIGNNIESMVLSCRVLGLGVENLFVRYVIDDLKQRFGFSTFQAKLVPTEKNSPCQAVYANNFFQQQNDHIWALNIDEVHDQRLLSLPDYFQKSS